jgi:uncharacterized oxidoreductase
VIAIECCFAGTETRATDVGRVLRATLDARVASEIRAEEFALNGGAIMKLSGNTILVTGGSGGIGLALAKKFVELDNDVTITGRRQEKLDAAVKANPKLKAIRSDAADPRALAEMCREIKQSLPKLNVLVNNAGVLVYRNLGFADDDLAALTSEIDINVSGPIRMVSALVDLLKANKGTIINVSSGLAFVPLTAAPIYSATKAAIHAYTITLRQQLQSHGVEVIELMPPAVRTELADYPDDPSFKVISTDELMTATFSALGKGTLEIRPGQANSLRFMSRVAPAFIQVSSRRARRVSSPRPRGSNEVPYSSIRRPRYIRTWRSLVGMVESRSPCEAATGGGGGVGRAAAGGGGGVELDFTATRGGEGVRGDGARETVPATSGSMRRATKLPTIRSAGRFTWMSDRIPINPHAIFRK